MSYVAELDGVTFSYRRRRVLTGASWSVQSGVTALLGPNGAGKTTLLKCLVGLASPKTGRVTIMGRSSNSAVERRQAYRHIGFVPQNPSLPGMARVADIVGYAGWLSGLANREVGGGVAKALDALDLTDLSSRRIRTLSGGQRQRVALATGIVHEPAILVLDEPTVGLDPGQRLKVRELIGDIGGSRAVILSTHLTDDAQYLADSVAVLANGRIRYQGSLGGLATERFAATDPARPGSEFERAYDKLMETLGGSRD